jgi:predicted TPR repeat methyltransferase
MCDELRYVAPDVLATAIRRCLTGRSGLAAVDLGCGTGLFGLRIRPLCKSLAGVDLSPEMLEQSRSRDVYDDLECAEITAWLAEDGDEAFDLIGFCDTLIYFGDLKTVLSGCLKHLKPGGLVAFTLEKGETAPFQLADSGRFQHHKTHVRDAARMAGLEVLFRTEQTLRMEYGVAVTGLVTVLQKPDH